MTSNKITLEPRYELDQLVPRDSLTALLKPFVTIVKLAAGIVRNKKPDEEWPGKSEIYATWRYTPVLGIDRTGTLCVGGSEFCRAIRALTAGDRRCFVSDHTHTNTAYAQRSTICYRCDPANLKDMVAPITVGGHHLANVYLGQFRLESDTFRDVWERYVTVMGESTNSNKAMERADLERLYNQLWTEREVPALDALQNLLTRLAELISQRAAREASLRAIAEICGAIGPCFDNITQAETVLGKLSKVLRFTSGSIVLLDEGQLRSAAAVYPDTLPSRIVYDPSDERGIVPHVFRERKIRRFATRADLDAFIRPSVADSREKRGIESLLVAPLVAGEAVVGVVEIGDTQQNVYGADDEALIKALADYMAMRWKSNENHRALTKIMQENRLADLLNSVVQQVPALVHGRGCSVFLRDIDQWRVSLSAAHETGMKKAVPFDRTPAKLIATSEFPAVFDGAYEPRTGLTGWVLHTGRIMRLDGGPGARTTNMPKFTPPAEWKGFLRREDPQFPHEYYTDRPFLAAPIRALNGTVLGVIRIPDGISTTFAKSDEDILRACASSIAMAIEARSNENLSLGIERQIGEIRRLVCASTESAKAAESVGQKENERNKYWILSRTAALLSGSCAVVVPVLVIGGCHWTTWFGLLTVAGLGIAVAVSYARRA